MHGWMNLVRWVGGWMRFGFDRSVGEWMSEWPWTEFYCKYIHLSKGPEICTRAERQTKRQTGKPTPLTCVVLYFWMFSPCCVDQVLYLVYRVVTMETHLRWPIGHNRICHCIILSSSSLSPIPFLSAVYFLPSLLALFCMCVRLSGCLFLLLSDFTPRLCASISWSFQFSHLIQIYCRGTN